MIKQQHGKALWFEGVNDESELKKRWHELALKHHSDQGGDDTIMMEINIEYQEALVKIRTGYLPVIYTPQPITPEQSEPQPKVKPKPKPRKKSSASSRKKRTPIPEPEAIDTVIDGIAILTKGLYQIFRKKN